MLRREFLKSLGLGFAAVAFAPARAATRLLAKPVLPATIAAPTASPRLLRDIIVGFSGTQSDAVQEVVVRRQGKLVSLLEFSIHPRNTIRWVCAEGAELRFDPNREGKFVVPNLKHGQECRITATYSDGIQQTTIRASSGGQSRQVEWIPLVA
jgi:hypothetical protein